MAIRLIRSMYFAIISKQRNGKEDFNMSKYLVVIDMQKDFIDGSLGTKEAQAIVPKVIEKVAEFKGPVMLKLRKVRICLLNIVSEARKAGSYSLN